MKIKFKETPEQKQLFQAMASKEFEERRIANEAFAEFVGPLAQGVIETAPTLSNGFTTMTYDRTQSQTIPLDQFYDIRETDYVRVWSQSSAGGLATNQTHSIGEIPFVSYNLNTAISIKKRQAEEARLPFIANTMARSIQELLVKQERDASKVVFDVLANASTSYESSTYKHVMRAGTPGTFSITDLNKMFTRADRLRSSWAEGTALTSEGKGLSVIYVSPEIIEQIRNMAFNPLASGSLSDIAGTDELRNSIYKSTGRYSFYDIDIIKLSELGIGKRFNKLFDVMAGATTYDGTAFDETASEIIVGINQGPETLIRPVEVDADNNSVTSQSDNQWVSRAETLGWTLSVREGRMSVDSRDILGLIV